jgi:hypothetical protein
MSGNNSQQLLADMLKWKQRYRETKAEVEKLTGQIKERDEKLAAMEADLDTFAQGFEELESQLQTDPDGLRARIGELEGELWTRDTRSTFDRLAKDAKVRDEARDDLWSVLGLSPDGETEITEEVIRERMGEAVKARAYMLQSEPETGNGAAGAAQGRSVPGGLQSKPPGPGVGRGAPEPLVSNDPRKAAAEHLHQMGAVSGSNLRLA